MLVNGCHKKILFLTLCLFSFNYAICLPRERENQHLFPLLGYLHGYKLGQNFAYQLPSFVLSPVVMVSSMNQQKSINVQKSTADENYQENGATFQIINPSKLIMNPTDEYGEAKTSKTDILERHSSSENNTLNSDHDAFKQVITNNTEVTTESNNGIIEVDNENVTSTTDITNTEDGNLKVTTQTQSRGPYPNALYKNENINILSITTASPMNAQRYSIKSLPLTQNNLTLSNTENKKAVNKDKLKESEDLRDDVDDNIKENSNIYPTVKLPYSYFKTYSFLNPWHKPAADKLSTTSSYTNYESPLPLANDDRWQGFSSLRKYPTSDFQPLAGIYHDGFLHKYLIKSTGFHPANSKYLYDH